MTAIIRYIASNHVLGWGIVIGVAVLIIVLLEKHLANKYKK